MVRISTEVITPCGWGILLDGVPTCPINPPPAEANPEDKKCPAYDVETCSRAWAEHDNCPKHRVLGHYGGSNRRK